MLTKIEENEILFEPFFISLVSFFKTFIYISNSHFNFQVNFQPIFIYFLHWITRKITIYSNTFDFISIYDLKKCIILSKILADIL